MQARSRSILDVFDTKKRYLVPLFQRQYVWSLENQWEPFWDDIKSKACAILSKKEVPPHFLGAIVLDQKRTYGNEVPSHIIIDGQQRLTTFQIFLSAFRNLCNSLGLTKYGNELNRYILNTGIMENEAIEQFKVWPSKMDQQPFSDVVLLTSMEDVLNCKYCGKSKIVDAYMFFSGVILDYLQDEEYSNDDSNKIESLYQTLRKYLEVVTIELEGQDDAQVIFETLNARGEPLLPSDLLRNYLFMKAAQNKESQDFLYEKYWEQFDQHFWKKEEKQGRLKRPRIDLFMQHFLQLKRSREINIGRMFQEYKNMNNELCAYKTVEEELIDLDRFAGIYNKFLVPDISSRLGLFAQRLRDLDISTVYPLLLYLVGEAKISEVELNGIIIDLESYLIRRLVCGKTTKNYNLLFIKLLRDLKKIDVNRRSLQLLLLELSGEAVVLPDDKEFNKAWIDNPSYDKLKSNKIVLILKALEAWLHSEKTENVLIRSPLTIEHVMPEGWIEKWPLSDGFSVKDKFWFYWWRDGDDDDKKRYQLIVDRDNLIHTFGNLTLLTSKLNSSISNGSFDSKRPDIIKQSSLLLNTHFQDIEVWDENNIRMRGQKLFDIAKKIWPYPEVSM